ncbi:MAG: hypothetical protein IPH07_27570 [Deltaproteobacteria bacterium]|nr:hypothetical protein [Deltaproteobacteria bacterium]MBP7291845.1 hypothetical protein [Nannocystaceae bacterium]
MLRTSRWLLLASLACESTTTTAPGPANSPAVDAAPGAPAAESPKVATAAEVLPPVAPTIAPPPAHATCGPFDSRSFAAADRKLLDDRLRLRFLPGGEVSDSRESARIEVVRDGVTLFVGARERFARGDDRFEQRATKVVEFGGGYDPAVVPGRDGKVSIVTGFVREPDPAQDMVAVAHGYFLDPNRDVLDVAVFVSPVVGDPRSCHDFAKLVLGTVTNGERRLPADATAEVTTSVTYASFRHRLPPGWLLLDTEGIEDFARMQLRRRGSFPEATVSMTIGVDAHPGDWRTPGSAESGRGGTVLGVPVEWNLTAGLRLSGAWTVSQTLLGRDHVVASIIAETPAQRDEAIAVAESIVWVP